VTASGTAVSSTNFTVLPTFHDRSLSLGLRKHLVARGNVAVSDGFAACREDVPVRIQRKVAGDWHTIASTITDSAAELFYAGGVSAGRRERESAAKALCARCPVLAPCRRSRTRWRPRSPRAAGSGSGRGRRPQSVAGGELVSRIRPAAVPRKADK
jgi:hypothetical protein